MRNLFFLVFCLGLVGCGVISDNLHQVGDKQPRMYRSAQLSGPRLAEVIEEKQIVSVINLRGENLDQSWYQAETQVCQQKLVEHHDIGISAYRVPSREKLLHMVEVFEDARAKNKIVLVHCQGGADRSSLASAVGQMVMYDTPSQQAAASSFWIGYGHVCMGNCALERVIAAYQLHSPRLTFGQWVRKHYQPELVAKEP